MLEYNTLGDDGVGLLAGALKDNRALQMLDLTNNSIGPLGGKGLAKALPPDVRALFSKVVSLSAATRPVHATRSRITRYSLVTIVLPVLSSG